MESWRDMGTGRDMGGYGDTEGTGRGYGDTEGIRGPKAAGAQGWELWGAGGVWGKTTGPVGRCRSAVIGSHSAAA